MERLNEKKAALRVIPTFKVIDYYVITLRAKLSGTVYCNRSCLGLFVCVWVCYHDNSKLHASIFTKLCL